MPSGRYHRQMAMIKGMAPTGTVGLDEAMASTAAACLYRGMSDPSRVAILRHLLLGEHNVAELTAHLALAQSTVSKHLACLRDCGLVDSRASGRASVFSLSHPEAVLGVFAATEKLLAATGDAVVLCPHHVEPVA